MRGGVRPGRPLEGRLTLGFEGVFAAGIGGSHPLGTRERREERRQEVELDGVSGRSLPGADPAVTALFANLDSGLGWSGGHSTELASGPLKPQPTVARSRIVPSRRLSAAMRWLSLCTQR